MKITLLDDYQDVVRTLDCFGKMAGADLEIWNDHVQDVDSLAQRLRDTEALLLIRERTLITEALLARLPRLKLISQHGSVPNIDLAACTRHGVTVSSRAVPGQPSYATAELTWGLLLAAWRRIPQEALHLKAGGWQSQEAVGITLRGRVLGVFGYGRIGGVVAGYGRAFGMKVRVWGRDSTLARARADGYETAASEDEFFAASDIVTLHLTLREDTRGIVRRRHLDLMKPGALIINTSRAPLIEEGALAAALQAGRPGRAAVDVFEDEPVLGGCHPLLDLPQVVATPHLGYVERDALESMFSGIFDQVLAYQAGRPINVQNPAA